MEVKKTTVKSSLTATDAEMTAFAMVGACHVVHSSHEYLLS